MKKQIQLVTLSALFFVAILSFVFTSCEKQDVTYGPTTYYKPCQNVICLNGGICRDGNCECAIGFEGVKCETRAADKFVSSYTCFDDCYKNAQESYTASISTDFNPVNELILKGVGTLCTNYITAYITKEKTHFDIPFQQSCNDYWISGEGNLYNDVLSVNLVIRDSAMHTTQNCSILMNK